MTSDPEFIRTKLALDVALRHARLTLATSVVVLCATLPGVVVIANAESGPRWPVDTCRSPGYSWGPGDDNCDGTITEDEAGWDCRTMGNNVCGPGNAQGVPPGDYSSWDEGGMNIEGWVTR